MQRTNLADIHCSIARTMQVLGEWWTPLILRDLLAGMSQFDDLQRDLGISTNVLSDRLRHLTEHGVVRKVPSGTHAKRFSYELTDKGLDVMPILVAIMAWGDRWEGDADGQPVTIVHRSCGHAAHAEPHCSACGQRWDLSDLDLQAGPGGRSAPGTLLIGQHLSRATPDRATPDRATPDSALPS